MSEEQTQELTEEQTEQQSEADFEAGFAEAHGDEPPAKPPAQEEQPEAEQADSAPPTSEAADESDPTEETDDTDDGEEPTIAGLKASEVKALLAKAAKYDELEGRVFGKFGEVQRTIQQMQQTAGGQRLALTADRLKRLSEFDPEFAEALAADLSEVLSPAAEGQSAKEPQQDPEQVKRLFEDRVAAATEELSQKFEAKLLTLKHPDWPAMTASEDFGLWKASLDEKTRNELSASWDASYLADKLNEFKAWRERGEKRKSAQQTNQRRLERAVVPEGAGGADSGGSDDDAFVAGFNAMRGT